MPRIQLQTKLPKQTIKKLSVKEDHEYIPMNDPQNFTLLTDNRHETEKFSRVDMYRVNHYYLIGTEWLCEVIFYPSSSGLEEFDTKEFDWEPDHPFKEIYKKLVETGVGLLGSRSIPNIKKPIKRLEIKCKPSRMALTCKE
jgi:hypothetical protein